MLCHYCPLVEALRLASNIYCEVCKCPLSNKLPHSTPLVFPKPLIQTQYLLFQAGLSLTSLLTSDTMTQQEAETFSLLNWSILSILPSFSSQPLTPLSECKVPGAWPSVESTLNMPGGWIENDEDWCQHICCWIETAFGFDHFCSRHKNNAEVVKIVLGELELS